MQNYKTKEEAENQIKEMNIPDAFSPTFIFPHWHIMSNVTGSLKRKEIKEVKR